MALILPMNRKPPSLDVPLGSRVKDEMPLPPTLFGVGGALIKRLVAVQGSTQCGLMRCGWAGSGLIVAVDMELE
jgi:hypothetical protein